MREKEAAAAVLICIIYIDIYIQLTYLYINEIFLAGVDSKRQKEGGMWVGWGWYLRNAISCLEFVCPAEFSFQFSSAAVLFNLTSGATNAFECLP